MFRQEESNGIQLSAPADPLLSASRKTDEQGGEPVRRSSRLHARPRLLFLSNEPRRQPPEPATRSTTCVVPPVAPAAEDHLVRLRHARRRGHVPRRPRTAVHLQPNGAAARVAIPVGQWAWHGVMVRRPTEPLPVGRQLSAVRSRNRSKSCSLRVKAPRLPQPRNEGREVSMSRRPVSVGGRADVAECQQELLGRLGLRAEAGDQGVEAAHNDLVEFLELAPHEVKSWAAARPRTWTWTKRSPFCAVRRRIWFRWPGSPRWHRTVWPRHSRLLHGNPLAPLASVHLPHPRHPPKLGYRSHPPQASLRGRSWCGRLFPCPWSPLCWASTSEQLGQRHRLSHLGRRRGL